MEVVLEGLDELLAQLRMLDKNAMNTAKQCVREGCGMIQADAKRLAPVDTGQLRGSIAYRVINLSDAYLIGEVFPTAKHAAYVEFGTGPRGQANHSGVDPSVPVAYRGGGWWYFSDKLGHVVYTQGQPARPFMYPAFVQNRERIVQNAKNKISGAIASAL